MAIRYSREHYDTVTSILNNLHQLFLQLIALAINDIADFNSAINPKTSHQSDEKNPPT